VHLSAEAHEKIGQGAAEKVKSVLDYKDRTARLFRLRAVRPWLQPGRAVG